MGLAAAMSSLNFFNSALCITSSGDVEEMSSVDDFRQDAVVPSITSFCCRGHPGSAVVMSPGLRLLLLPASPNRNEILRRNSNETESIVNPQCTEKMRRVKYRLVL